MRLMPLKTVFAVVSVSFTVLGAGLVRGGPVVLDMDIEDPIELRGAHNNWELRSSDSALDSVLAAQDEPAEPTCGPIKRDQVILGAVLHVPIANFLGQDDLCEASITVQNLGPDAAKASLVVYGEPGFCPPQAAGPLKVECTGLMRPGGTWEFSGAYLPNGTRSARIYRFSALRLYEIGVELGFNDVVADYMCETLFFGVVCDCGEFSRFEKAYNEGLEFGGIPQDLAAGEGILVAQVVRECPSMTNPGKTVRSAYNAISGMRLGACVPMGDGFKYNVPLVYADWTDLNTSLYVQNAGGPCALVEIWFQSQDSCASTTICKVRSLAFGESFSVDANECVGPGFRGSATIRSESPLAIVADIVGPESLMTYTAQPQRLNATFDPLIDSNRPDGTALFAPIVYNDYDGWDSAITVQSFDSFAPIKLRLVFLSESGDTPAVVTAWLCSGGSRTFLPAMILDVPNNWRGAVRVEAIRVPGDPSILDHDPTESRIAGVLHAWRDGIGEATGFGGGFAYSMRPEAEVLGWFDRSRVAGAAEGFSVIPRVSINADEHAIESDTGVVNTERKRGFTTLTVQAVDRGGANSEECAVVLQSRPSYFDLTTRAVLSPRFHGSLVVSAVRWDHNRFDDRGDYLGNDFGLVSAYSERSSVPDPTSRVEDPAIGVAGLALPSQPTLDGRKIHLGIDSPGAVEDCYRDSFHFDAESGR